MLPQIVTGLPRFVHAVFQMLILKVLDGQQVVLLLQRGIEREAFDGFGDDVIDQERAAVDKNGEGGVDRVQRQLYAGPKDSDRRGKTRTDRRCRESATESAISVPGSAG